MQQNVFCFGKAVFKVNIVLLTWEENLLQRNIQACIEMYVQFFIFQHLMDVVSTAGMPAYKRVISAVSTDLAVSIHW